MSDAIIISKAAGALRQSFYPPLRQLSVEGSDGNLVISGKVSSYHLKQLAQEAVMAFRGPLRLVNHVDVIGQ